MALPETASSNGGTLEKVTAFVKESKVELKKVTWPTRQELIVSTIVVLFAVALVAAAIWLVDSVFSILIRALLR